MTQIRYGIILPDDQILRLPLAASRVERKHTDKSTVKVSDASLANVTIEDNFVVIDPQNVAVAP